MEAKCDGCLRVDLKPNSSTTTSNDTMLQKFSLQRIRKLLPEGIISRDSPYKSLEIEAFFLSLAMLFNDIKGLVILEKDFKDKYEMSTQEISGHNGQYFGIKLQIVKYAAGILNESLRLISDNTKVLKTTQLQSFVNQLNTQDNNIWKLLLDVCGVTQLPQDDEEEDLKKFRTLLVYIRSNTAFHYYQSGKPLIEGFRKFFYLDEQTAMNQSAMYSYNSTDFDGTRYYYADAALKGLFEKEFLKFGSVQKVLEEIYILINEVAKVITGLLEVYHKGKPKN